MTTASKGGTDTVKNEVFIQPPPTSDLEVFNLCMKNSSCKLLAEVGYYEARSESDTGVAAVMHVVVNRKNHPKLWPNTKREVVAQKKQFSYRWDGSMKMGFKEREAHIRAAIIASKVISGEISDPTNGGTFYHTKAVSPSWAKKLTKTKVIGEHIFYC